MLSVTDHDTVASCGEAAAVVRGRRHPVRSRNRNHGGSRRHGRTHARIFSRHRLASIEDVSGGAAAAPYHPFARNGRPSRRTWHRAGRGRDPAACLQTIPQRPLAGPWIARALVAGGHVATVNEAFERWLATRSAGIHSPECRTAEEVIARIHDAGGVASIAHPGLLGHDEWLPEFVESGMDASRPSHRSYAGHDGPISCSAATWAWLCPADPTITPIRRTAVRRPGAYRSRARHPAIGAIEARQREERHAGFVTVYIPQQRHVCPTERRRHRTSSASSRPPRWDCAAPTSPVTSRSDFSRRW